MPGRAAIGQALQKTYVEVKTRIRSLPRSVIPSFKIHGSRIAMVRRKITMKGVTSVRLGADRATGSRVSRGSVKRIRLFEQFHVLGDVVAALLQGLRIPFAALGGEEVPTVDVDGAGQLGNRIGHRMNDVLAKGTGIFRRQRPRARGFQPAARHAAPGDVVLAAGI